MIAAISISEHTFALTSDFGDLLHRTCRYVKVHPCRGSNYHRRDD